MTRDHDHDHDKRPPPPEVTWEQAAREEVTSYRDKHLWK